MLREVPKTINKVTKKDKPMKYFLLNTIDFRFQASFRLLAHFN
jgi:hypothetical protein